MKHPKTELSKKPSFRSRRETGGPGENLRQQAWTGNQNMHIRLTKCTLKTSISTNLKNIP